MCFGKHEHLEVDEEMRLWIPKRTKEERQQLKENIQADGEIRDPVMVWGNIIVDGMGRVEIARELDLPFHIKRKDFRDNAECRAWMETNQLGRRNLSENAVRIMRGRVYNYQKSQRGGDQEAKCKPCTLVEQTEDTQRLTETDTAKRLAAQFGTGSRTIKSDGKLAEAADKLEPTVAAAVVNEEVKASRKDVEQLATKPKAEQKKIVAKVKSGAAKSVGEAMKPKPPKAGSQVGWTSDRDAEITSMMGKLIRLVDERGKAHKGRGHAKCIDALRAFGEEWKSWRTGKA